MGRSAPDAYGVEGEQFADHLASIREDIERRMDVRHCVQGVWWYDAPLPRRFHRCRCWTAAWHVMTFVERCACGGTRLNGTGPWVSRNERRRK